MSIVSGRKRALLAKRKPLATSVLPLDLVTGAVAAYSSRQLRTGFAGTPAPSVSAWADQSGNANNAVQATPANQPTVVTAGGFSGTHSTDGGSQFLAATDAASIQDIFFGTNGGFAIAVLDADWSGLSGGVISIFSKGKWILYGFPGGGGVTLWWYIKGTGGDGFWGTSTLLPAGKHIVSVAHDFASPGAPPVISIDGVPATIGTTNPTSGLAVSDAGQSFELGNNLVLNSNDRTFAGTIYEAMLFKGAVSSGNQATLIADLKAAYGIP